ncbi:hypothetical protein [Rhizobium grahamii]|uniref:hypothetical protein n=1 Tax=Rhizobium grahamii TaxID=1120045 RepID=UPI00167BE1A1|nr:hypothetical protein [Rhizobium grahamii]
MFSNLFKTDFILDDWGLENPNDDQRAISSRSSKTATSRSTNVISQVRLDRW